MCAYEEAATLLLWLRSPFLVWCARLTEIEIYFLYKGATQPLYEGVGDIENLNSREI